MRTMIIRRIRGHWLHPAAIITAAFLAVGCGTGKTSDLNLVLIDPAGAVELVKGQQRLLGLAPSRTGVWVDPRNEAQFLAGHIPGAVSLPYQNVTADHEKLKAFDVVIVYGDGYNDPKARGMSKRLIELGLKDVRTLHGGLRAWTAAGHPLEPPVEAASSP